ncbi:MAG TPA: putative Ig domain-containing protein, partial [Acidimicrobiales bacterium]
MTRFRRSLVKVVLACALAATFMSVVARSAAAAAPVQLNLNVLLIGTGSSDPTTAAWQSALTHEGVAYTLATATGAYGAETVTLPALTSGSVGNFNGVVVADSPAGFAAGQLSALDSYESSFGVRQVDGYMYPSPALGLTDVSGGALDGTTATLTAAGLAGLPGLKGTVPFDTGTYGYPSAAVAGAPFTPWMTDGSGHVLAGVYQHPGTDPQGGVAELSLTFNYNASMLQWLLLAPGLINWVTQDTHLGLYRNYFGQDIDDNFIADNSWSSQFQCTPGATQPPDYNCPAGVANNPADTPPDVQMSAADVAYVVAWEAQTGIKLNMAFNAVGACTAPSTAAESSANCAGSVTDPGLTVTDPGQVVDTTAPNDQALINALLTNKSSFNWVNHTWSHQFLGCVVWQPQAVNSVAANATGGSFTAGGYTYEVTAATAYGESEPSLPQPVTVAGGGSVTLSWPDATNGTGTDGTKGPTLAQEEANHTGGSGFWGYDVYRENPGSTTFGLVGQVAEDPSGATPTYGFTDTGAAPGAAPGSGAGFPTATNPGIDCSSAAGSWDPATSTTADSSIGQEIGLDQAFATANSLPNYTSAAVVTGEHSGVENPNMPAALAATGVTTFATDASRQPNQYSLTSGGSTATGAPRYPSNIYYNASNWADQTNEYNTLYVAPNVSIGPGETGHCAASSATTCLTTPATESSIPASESRIMLSHVLANDPRVGYAHQTNLIGPATANGADSGYTLLTLLNNMLAQYNAWTTTPLIQMTDVTDAQTLGLQSAWATAQGAGSVKATETNGVVTVTNSSGSPVSVPITVPPGTTVGGAAFGQSYGGELSAWTSVPAAGTTILTEHVAPAITSANAATSIVGAPFSATVTTTGYPAPAITETGALPAGMTFVDNGNGTATLAGTAQAGTGKSYPITITATSTSGTATQAFTLTNAEAPSITSAATASFSTGVAGTYTVTTTGYPAATITESGALPTGLAFTDKGNGTATLAGTPAAGTAGSYPVTISATNLSGSTVKQTLAITVTTSAAPVITSGATAYFTLNQSGAFAVTTTGSPTPAITETGALPAGLTFTANGNGTALVSGTPTAAGTTTLAVTAANGITPNATQTLSIIVGQGPAITSAASATATAGTAFSFTVTATGYPAPTLGETGALPAGVTFVSNGNGTATISGTPTATGGGSYPLTISAINGTGTATQAFTLDLTAAATITSAASTTFTVGQPASFTVTTAGFPTPKLTESGALPSGVAFTDNGNGTATLTGTLTAASVGAFKLTISATNSIGTANQAFTLTVISGSLSITSAASTTFTAGTAGSFTVTATGTTTPTITEGGALPAGIT